MKKNQLKNFSFNFLFSLLLLFFTISSKAQLNLTSAGSVGVGTSAPGAKFEVTGGAIKATYASGSSFYSIIFTRSAGNISFPDISGNGTNPLVISGNASGGGSTIFGGSVGIGLSPSYQLQLSTNSAAKPTSSTWSVASDVRTKRNIQNYTHGLDLIRKVKLVSYTYNGMANTPNGDNGIGVIAQDFQNVFPNSVKPFIFVNDSTKTSESFLSVDFHELFVTNIRAVQELDKIVSQQDSTIKAQNNKIDELQNQILNCCNNPKQSGATYNNAAGNNINDAASNSTAILYQNIPNPFYQETSIQYFIPTNSSSASIMLFDLNGKLVNTIPVTLFGKGAITINGNKLEPGMFVYSLIVDNKIIDTKRMILTK